MDRVERASSELAFNMRELLSAVAVLRSASSPAPPKQPQAHTKAGQARAPRTLDTVSTAGGHAESGHDSTKPKLASARSQSRPGSATSRSATPDGPHPAESVLRARACSARSRGGGPPDLSIGRVPKTPSTTRPAPAARLFQLFHPNSPAFGSVLPTHRTAPVATHAAPMPSRIIDLSTRPH